MIKQALPVLTGGAPFNIATGRMHFAEVGQVERVGPIREARRHRVIVILEPHAPLRAALATDLVVVLRHGSTVTPGRDNTARCPS